MNGARPNDPSVAPNDPWYWTAIDLRTGKTTYKLLAGNGSQWNNHDAGIHLGPNGTEYLSGLPVVVSVDGFVDSEAVDIESRVLPTFDDELER